MNKLFSLHLTHLPKWRYQGVLVAALLVVVLGFGALSFAPTAHAASRTQTSLANRSTVAMQAASTVHGCPLGYVCIYSTLAAWNSGHPEGYPNGPFYYYGSYPIYNQYGTHYVFNNQTSAAILWLCTDSYGNTCPLSYEQPAGYWALVNLTPINSVKLAPNPLL